jgi:hypothetical protein
VEELNRLLEPSTEFIKLAVKNPDRPIETGSLTQAKLEAWKPILVSAIQEWAKQYTLTNVLQGPSTAGPSHTGATYPAPSSAEKSSKPGPGSVALADLIAAKILTPPLKLFRKYKGQVVEASLLPNGQIMFQGVAYASCSQAGAAARKSVTGQQLSTNGWSFWQYHDGAGNRRPLEDARRDFVKTKKGQQGEKTEQAQKPGLRKKFWEGLLNRPRVKTTRHANIAPGEFSWIGAGSGVKGLPFVYAVQKDESRVELYIDRGAGKAAENKEIFDRIHKHKEEIEKIFGGELSWQRLDDKQGCRVAYVTAAGGYRSDESKWPGIQDTLIDAMIRLEIALSPHLAKLKAEF